MKIRENPNTTATHTSNSDKPQRSVRLKLLPQNIYFTYTKHVLIFKDINTHVFKRRKKKKRECKGFSVWLIADDGNSCV